MIKLTMGLGGVVFLLMMIFGLVMRTAQCGIIDFEPAIFYQLLTAHGAGMVGSAALSGAAIMWYFVARYVDLNPKVYLIFLWLFLAGAVLSKVICPSSQMISGKIPPLLSETQPC